MKKIIKWIIAGAVVIVIVLLVIKLVQDSKIGNNASEKELIRAAQKYFKEKPYLLPSENYAMEKVNSNILVERNYLKQKKDSNGMPRQCSSYITVTNVGGEYFYNPFVKCGISDDTILLYDRLVAIAKEENKNGENGLFIVGDKYIFRGDKPANHILFAGKKWRIMSLNEDKTIKLFYNGDEAESRVWDDRFNIEANSVKGVNDYSISRVKEYVNTYINNSTNFSNKSKAKLAFMDLCIGKRDLEETSIDGRVECSQLFEHQLIGIPSVNEYLSISNDPNCPSLIRSCSNYNFMARKSSFWSLTPVGGNTHQVYRVFPEEGLIARDATSKIYAYPVISLKGDVAILSGSGTSADPFVLK